MIPSSGYYQGVKDFKREFLLRTLEASNGNRTRAAKILGLQRTYLHRLIRTFSLPISCGKKL